MSQHLTPVELVEQFDLARLAQRAHQLALRLLYVLHGVLPLPEDERAATALEALAFATATADRALADRWRWALIALDAGCRSWLARALDEGRVSVAYVENATQVLDDELAALAGPGSADR